MIIKKYAGKIFATVASAVLLAASAHAALVGRDINGVAVLGSSAGSVFLYDTDLNITWLRNANAGAGSSFDNGASSTDGRMTWANANNWATTLTVGSYSGWRLPTTKQPDPTCSDSFVFPGFGIQSTGSGCTGSEMGHLWHTELGNAAGGPMTNTGNFQNIQNVQASGYWSGTDANAGKFDFFMINGSQGNLFVEADWSALAVRPGDVLAPTQVPEPGTLLLAALALAGMGVVRRRR